MFVKFENKHVELYLLKKGTLVEFDGDYYHIQHVYKDESDKIRLVLNGAFEDKEVFPSDVVWL